MAKKKLPKVSRKVAPKKKAKKALPCIAPKCRQPSKGPRFFYTCEKHREAKKAQIKAWQAAVVVSRRDGTIKRLSA